MSPLAALLLRVMRVGALAAAAFVALVVAIELWRRWPVTSLGAQDTAFMVVLLLLLAGFLLLARAIGRFLRTA